jgi:hypothetical protein
VQSESAGEAVDGLEGTVGAKLLRRDGESRVVVNFHGVSIRLCLIFYLVSFFALFVRGISGVSGTIFSLFSIDFFPSSYCCSIFYLNPPIHHL